LLTDLLERSQVIFGYDVQAEQNLELQYELNAHIKLMTKDGQKDCRDKGRFDDETDNLLLEGPVLGEDYQAISSLGTVGSLLWGSHKIDYLWLEALKNRSFTISQHRNHGFVAPLQISP